MKKITFLLFSIFTTSSMLVTSQTVLTTTKVVDISGVQSWDASNSPNNIVITVPLDGFSDTADCDNPVLELIGTGYNTYQVTVTDSWLSDMKIEIGSNLVATPAFNSPNPGTGSFSSDGIVDLIDIGLNSTIAHATTGSINIEFYEDYDDYVNAVDGIYGPESTITLQYRLSCSNTLSIDKTINLESVGLYPNVVNDVVTITNPKHMVMQQAQIFDTYGKSIKIIELSNINTDKTIDVSALSAGNYVVKLQTESGNVIKRFIKK